MGLQLKEFKEDWLYQAGGWLTVPDNREGLNTSGTETLTEAVCQSRCVKPKPLPFPTKQFSVDVGVIMLVFHCAFVDGI